jgi:DNA gyrase subunit B
VEGDSAAGSLLQGRDPKITAIFPLKGKIPNISGAKDILKNKEIGELIQALGTGVEPHFDLTNLRYDKIICATDADPDGSHIACLLTMVIAILLPELIKQGKYFIAQTPLFAINEGKTFIPLWNEKELKEAQQKNAKISRFKGLGELNPWQLKTCLVDTKTRKLIPVTYTKDIDKMTKLFSDVEEKRQLLLKVVEDESGRKM